MREVINHMAAKLAKVAMITGIVAGAVVGPFAIANAATNSQYCSFGEKLSRNITVSNNQASATFDIPKHCAHNLKYSLVVYTICDPSMRPFSAQKFHASKTMKFDSGTKTISGVHVPSNTYYQVDLIKGDPIHQLSDEGTYAPAGRLITAIAGGEPCPAPVVTTETPPATPETPPVTVVVNENTNTNNQTQTTTSTPAKVHTPVEVGKGPSVLPSTGPASVATAFIGVSSLSAMAYSLVQRRLKL